MKVQRLCRNAVYTVMYFYSCFYFSFSSRCSEVLSDSICFYSFKQNKYYSYLNPGSQGGVVSIVTRQWSGI